MSSYATISDLNVYGLPATALDGVDQDVVQAALDAASTVADGYLGTRYTIPFPSPGSDLKDVVCRIAAFNLMATRGYNPDGDAGQLRLRYEDAIRWLEQVAREKIQPSGAPAGADGNAVADFATFSNNNLRGWGRNC